LAWLCLEEDEEGVAAAHPVMPSGKGT
jgi:hypothetical protein